jgi:hypothetical protein
VVVPVHVDDDAVELAQPRHGDEGYDDDATANASIVSAGANIDGHGGRIDQPNRVEQLQLADVSASAIFQAFEPDQFGNTETRYLTELAPRLYRCPPGLLTSYGLKMHPLNETTKAAYPWAATL